MSTPPFRLVAWVFEQRIAHSNGSLTEDQVEKMLEIPGMSLALTDDDYIWCNDAKQDKREGKLSAEDIAACERIPGWDWDVETDEEFNAMHTLMKKFVKEHGHMPVA